MEERTALIFGSSGLVGSYLVDELCESTYYSTIRLFVRKPVDIINPRFIQNLIDFDNLSEYKELMHGDDLYICLGTTLKKAGSVENVEKIDYQLPIRIAQIALENGVKSVAIVSSIGANKDSKNYYLRTKGKMEYELLKLDFQNICIVRPSLLLGERKEKRFGEGASKVFMVLFGFFLIGKLRKFRAIHGRTVARAMIKLLRENRGKILVESDKLQIAGR